MNFPSKCLNLHRQHTRRQSPKQAHPIPPVEYWMRLMHPSSLAAGTAGQSTRCGMNDAETDPCFCKCCSLCSWARTVAQEQDESRFLAAAGEVIVHSFPSSLALSLPGSSGWQQSQVKRTSGGNLNFGCSPRRHSDQWLSLLDLLPPCYIYEPGQLCLLRFSLISPKNIKKLILPILQCIAASKFLSSLLTCSVSFSLPRSPSPPPKIPISDSRNKIGRGICWRALFTESD